MPNGSDPNIPQRPFDPGDLPPFRFEPIGPPGPVEREPTPRDQRPIIDPNLGFQGPIPGIGQPGVPIFIPPATGTPAAPTPPIGSILARLGIGTAIASIAIELLKRIGDDILERESVAMQREFEEEIRILRRQAQRARGTPFEVTVPEPLRRAPQPVFIPARPQRVEEPPLIAQPLPEVVPEPVVVPTQVPSPVVFPAPVEIPAPTLPGTTQPLPVPKTRPATRPSTRPVPVGVPFPFPIGLPLPLPSVRPLPRPSLRPSLRPIADPVPRSIPRDLTQPRPVSVPFAQARPSQCPPCPQPRCRKKDEEPEEPRDVCMKKLVKEGRFPSLDQSFDWVEINCETGAEL